MKKIFLLLMLLALSLSSFSCGGAGPANLPPGENPGVASVVQLLPSQYIAQTNASIYLHAKVLDGNGAPLPNITVTFTNLSEQIGFIQSLLRLLGISKSVGVLGANVALTNSFGIATVKLTSTTSGFATIQAEVKSGAGQIRDRKTVYFSSFSLSLLPFLTLSVDDGDGIPDQSDDFNLFKNATDNQRTITATVFDRFGNPMFGSTVTFGADMPYKTSPTGTCSDGSTTCNVVFPNGNTKTTGTDGKASVLVEVNPSILTPLITTLNITASADNGAANMVTLFLQPVTVSSVSVSANPNVVAPNATSTIVAVAKMLNTFPVPDGSMVNFSTNNCGSVTPFSGTTTGVATATFTAPSIPGTCTVTASIGGQSNTATVTVTTSLSVQPSSQTINGVLGGTVTYQIFGGVAAYKVTSNNPGIAFSTTQGNGTWDVAASGGTFTVTVPQNTQPTTVTLTIRDQIGTTVTATLTIGAGNSLSVQPSSQTIDGSAGGDATFTIFGGAPGYLVFANTANPQLQPDPSSVAASGDTFTIHVPANTPTTTVVYTIKDSLSGTPNTTTATLTITSPALPSLKVSPTSASIDGGIGGTVTFTIIGGSPGYTITSSNTGISGPWPKTVASSGGTFDVAILAGTAAQTITLTIIDSASTNVTATITVTKGAVPALSVLPGAQSVSSVTGGTVTFTIIGGTPGYTITTSNTSISGPWPKTVTSSGGTFSITVPAGTPAQTITYVIVDTASASQTATITVTAIPALQVSPVSQSVDGGAGGTVTFTIIGGAPGYNITASNTSISGPWPKTVTSSGGTFSITVPASTPAQTITYTIVDTASTVITATVTVTAPAAGGGLLIVPGSVTVESSALVQTVLFTITGGTPGPGYITTSTDPANAYDSVPGDGIFSGSPITVHIPANATAANVTLNVFDSVGGKTSATITILAPPAPPTPGALAVNPSTISVTGLPTGNPGDNVTFYISGGSGTYSTTAFSDNTAVIPPAAVAAAQFTIDPNPVSTTQTVLMTITDSLGTPKSATVTVTPATSSLTLNPSTISVAAGSGIRFYILGGTGSYLLYTTDTTCAPVPGGLPAGTSYFDVVTGGTCASKSPTITIQDATTNAISKITIQ